MNIEIYSRNDDLLKVDVSRKVNLQSSAQKEFHFSDGSSIKDANSLVLIQGPLGSHEKLLIISRSEEDPYVVSSGLEGDISVENKENVLQVTLISSSSDGIVNRLNARDSTHKILHDIWKKLESKCNENQNQENKEKFVRDFLIDKFESGAFLLDELIEHVKQNENEYKSTKIINYCRFSLTIVSIILAARFIQEKNFNLENSIYHNMSNVSWIVTKLFPKQNNQ